MTAESAAARLDALTTESQVEQFRRVEAAAISARDLMLAHAAVCRARLERIKVLAAEARAIRAAADADLAEAAQIAAQLAADLAAPTLPAADSRPQTPAPTESPAAPVKDRALAIREAQEMFAAADRAEVLAAALPHVEEKPPVASPTPTPEPASNGRRTTRRR